LIGVICLLFVALIGGTFATNKLLTSRATVLTSSKAKNQALSQEQVSLTKAKKDLKTYADLQTIARAVVPEDKNQAEAVREIVNIAADHNITLATINFPASTLGATATGSASSPSPTAVAPKVNVNSKANGLSQLVAVPSIPGVYELPITIVSETTKPVAYDRFIGFLSALEHNRRTAQVSSITITPSATNRGSLSFTLSIKEYIKP
jgi:hypothetical protein